jgi:hypothetical protein
MFSWLVFAALVSPLASADVSRPLEGEGPTRVYVAIFVLDVDEINSPNQRFDANVYLEFRWRDRRLAHSGPNEVSRSTVEVWHPRIQLINQQKVWPTFPDIVEIAPDGAVVYRQRVWGSFSQPLELQDFPFDRHVFKIQLAAFGYTPDEVELVLDPDSVSGIARHLSVADWEILGWEVEPGPFEPAPGEQPIAGFAFSFEAERQTGYFIVKVIIPLVFIVAMSWVVFWIDPAQSGTQISVAITTMLTLIAYRFAIGATLPKVSYLTRLDYFILLSTVLVFASLIEVVVTSTLARTEKLARARAMDRWARWLFSAAFALVVVGTLIL